MLLNLKVKKLHLGAILPKSPRPGDAGLDLHADHALYLMPGPVAALPTGIAVEIPEGYVGLVCPRSGLALNHEVDVANGPGVIDSNFRGELQVLLRKSNGPPMQIKRGDRIAQLILVPVAQIAVTEVDDLSPSNRGTDGFGSTGVAPIQKELQLAS